MTSKKKLPISVIIPTMNRNDSLKRTLFYIVQFDYVPDEIILIDQSFQNEVRYQNRLLLKECRTNYKYFYLENPSSTKARNIGLKNAENNIIVFLDDDVDVEKDTFRNIYRYMCDENIAMIGGLDELNVIENKKSRCNSFFSYFFGTKTPKKNIGYVTKSMLGRYPDSIEGVVPTMWAMGYCFIIRKSLAEEWNLYFDEKMTGYAYAEDLDFTFSYYKHASENNMKCILTNEIKVKHLVSKEFRIPSNEAIYKSVINRAYLGYKHHMGITSTLAQLWTNLGFILLNINSKEIILTRIKAQIYCESVRKKLKRGYLEYNYKDKV